jgi:hypothetical protein
MLQMKVAPKKRGIITVNKSIREPGQKRFVIAHEIGHYELPILLGLTYGLAHTLSPFMRRVHIGEACEPFNVV